MFRMTALAVLFATSFIANASEQAQPKADAAKGKTIAESVCVACHGADGNSLVPIYPHLAAQGEEYIVKQLKNFKMIDGKPAARNNPIMMGMAATLSDDDARNVAAWYASQKPKAAAAPAAKTEGTALGQTLWRRGDFAKGIPACAGCHGPAGAGLPAQYPRLAGQSVEYTDAQLKAFRIGERANDAEKVMRTIAAKLSDAEIKAVAEYAAGL